MTEDPPPRSIRALHDLAMEAANRGMVAAHTGRHKQAFEFYRTAWQCEREAAALVVRDARSEPTRSILYRSAAWCALDCGEHADAIRLALAGLEGLNIPPSLVDELEEVLYAGIKMRAAEATLISAGEQPREGPSAPVSGA